MGKYTDHINSIEGFEEMDQNKYLIFLKDEDKTKEAVLFCQDG